MSSLPEALQRLLKVQHNVVSAEQLRSSGLSRRRLRWLINSGEWQRHHVGIYFAGKGDLPLISRAWAAILLCGEDAVVGGASAARLHRLTTDDPAEITVYVPNWSTPSPREGMSVVRSRTKRKVQVIDGVRCTHVPETIVDCAAELGAHELEALIGRAFQRSKCTAGALRKAVNGRRTVAQRVLLEAAATDAAAGAHSVLEMLYLRDVERAHGLPAGQRQVRVSSAREWVDVLYPEYGIVVELDGKSFHADAPFRDRARDNRNSRLGLKPLRFGWADITGDPCGIAREIAALMGIAEIGTCGRCADRREDDRVP